MANHLNDISKDHPSLAVDLARRWPLEMFQPHSQGWNHYLDRLVVRAEGECPKVRV